MIHYEIWQAPVGQGAFERKYNPDHPWVMVWREEVPEGDQWALAEGLMKPKQFCDGLFKAFQRVSAKHMPPDGYRGRSLTAGDLIRVGSEWFFCAAYWDQVKPPSRLSLYAGKAS